jgi:ribulose-phosphate 3-epimerase
MIVEPDRYLAEFQKAGADVLTVHIETCPHLHRTVQHIKNLGMKASVCLNPHTPVSLLEEILPNLDMVLIMSVNPGFGAQRFIEGSYEKIRKLKKMILQSNTEVLIEVDGGVNLNNIAALSAAGADVFVVGNAVFSAADPLQTISQLKKSSKGN